MMRKITLGAATAIALLALSVASVSALNGSSATSPISPATNVLDLPVFQKQVARSPATISALGQLKTQATTYDADSIPASADYAKAVPVLVPGTTSKFAWIVPTRTGDICGFIPQFGSGIAAGFSSVCSTLSDFNESGLFVLNNGPNGKYLMVSVQPNGSPAPTATAPNGDTRELSIASGVTIASIESGESLSVRGNTFSTSDLDRMQDPSKVLSER